MGAYINSGDLAIRRFSSTLQSDDTPDYRGGTNPCSEIFLSEPKENILLSLEPKIYFAIKKVIFNDPATIIVWGDGTKTVVKTQNGEVFDKEKGFAMALLKKMSGNKGNYYNLVKKWVE